MTLPSLRRCSITVALSAEAPCGLAGLELPRRACWSLSEEQDEDEKREVGILLLFSSWGDPSTRVTHHRLRRFNNVEPGYTLVAQKGETEIHPVCPFKVHLEQVDPVEYIISRDTVNFHYLQLLTSPALAHVNAHAHLRRAMTQHPYAMPTSLQQSFLRRAQFVVVARVGGKDSPPRDSRADSTTPCDRANHDSMNTARAPKQAFHCHRRCSSSNTAGIWHIVLSRP
jgi:hypothetical protein